MKAWYVSRVSVFVLVLGICCGAPAGAFALSGGRVYEMVSPAYKGGYGATEIVAVPPDGESVAFGSVGAFAGDPSRQTLANYYFARRSVFGWSTTPLTVPAAIVPFGGIIDFSATLDSTLSEARLGPNLNFGSGSYDSIEDEYLLHGSNIPDTAPNFEVAGVRLKALDKKYFTTSYLGGSPDFSHVLFDTQDPLLSEAVKTNSRIYDLATQSLGGIPLLRLVGLNNKHEAIEPVCQVAVGVESGKLSAFNAVAADGKEIFFTTGVSSECAQREQLFVRVGGSWTLEVSRPLLPVCHEVVPCPGAVERAPAEFQGASEDGSKVFFITAQSLVREDNDTARDLYMAKIGCLDGNEECEPSGKEVTSLVQVSHGKEPANLQDVVAMAPDGSHVYFVAQGVLSEGPNVEGNAPVRGADNLYVYDSTSGKSPVFIADLCSGPELSGEVEDVRCPAGLDKSQRNDTFLWASNQPEAQVNACGRSSVTECAGDREPGRFLVFSSYGQLTAGDTDTAKDVYRYDASSGTLDRVSVGEAGYDANGNGNGNGNGNAMNAIIARNLESHGVYEQRNMNSRAISEDGSRIVFTTEEPLSPAAGNGLANVYEWHKQPSDSEGNVSLISTGSSDQPVESTVISQTGNDVFFKTSQGLVPQDTDGQLDIYDARLGGGFPSVPASVQPCSGDACQGPLTNPAPLLVPGSVLQAPGGNFAAPVSKRPVKAKARRKRKVKPSKKGRTRSRRSVARSAGWQ